MKSLISPHRQLARLAICCLLSTILWPADSQILLAEGDSSAVAISDRSTPKQAMVTFFRYAMASSPQHNFELAGAGFDLSQYSKLSLAERRRKGAQLAAMFLKTLDAKGFYVDISSLPDTPNTQASNIPIHPSIKQFYLVKKDGAWLLSSYSVSQIQPFYDSVISRQARWILEHLPAPFMKTFLGLAVWQYTGMFLALFLGLFVRRMAIYFSEAVILRLATRSRYEWDDALVKALGPPIGLLMLGAILGAALPNLQLGVRVSYVLRIAVLALTALAVIWFFYRLIDVLAGVLEASTARTETKLDDQLVPILRKTLKVFVVLIGVVTLLQNLNVNVGSLLAGLGLGGLAFALAAQDTLSNLFGSVMILLDRPFQIGDWVIIGEVEGTVEEVGLRSTRIRTFYKSLVTIPNSKLVQIGVDNMGERTYRRIKTYLSLTYSTTPAQMEAFVEGVRQIILANPFTWKEYFHVYFNQFGAASLDVLLYCFIDTDDWGVELRERNRIFLEILRLAEEVGVEFAFPTQTLHIDSFPGRPTRPVGKQVAEAELRTAATAFGPGGHLAQPGGIDMRPEAKE